MTNEPANDSPSGRIAEAIGSRLRQPTSLRMLVGMRMASPVLSPVLFAVVSTLLFGPIYARLKRRGIPTPVALKIVPVGPTLLFAVIFYVLGASISRFSAGLGSYAAEKNGQSACIEALFDRSGLSNVGVREVVGPSALVGTARALLSGLDGFLRNLFLILMVMLFLLAEGPSLMDRLRANAGRDHPQVAGAAETHPALRLCQTKG